MCLWLCFCSHCHHTCKPALNDDVEDDDDDSDGEMTLVVVMLLIIMDGDGDDKEMVYSVYYENHRSVEWARITDKLPRPLSLVNSSNS